MKLEPDNLMALFNRALLLEQTGNLRAAIRDYSKVIEEYPNFWFGLQHRASCYRRLGNTKQAELDEFRILKAQMDKRFGHQPRLSKKQMRKRSDEDMEKYNQLVVADEQEVEHEYKSEYRGRVQNRKAELSFLPMFSLSFLRPVYDVKTQIPYEESVEAFNTRSKSRPVYISDLGIYLQIDSTSSLAYWQRAVCQAKMNEFNAAQGTNIELQMANVLGDLSDAIKLAPKNGYLYYNRGTLYALRNDNQRAIDDYTRAIQLEQNLAEAYYNRGLVYIRLKRVDEAITDLSKAGELGLYQAYSVIKKYTSK